MSIKVLIAHAKDDKQNAEKLAVPIRAAGYEVAHEGTVLVGDSIIAEASRLLADGCPVVVCGTVRAMGTSWARRLVNGARAHSGVRIFIVQMEEDADTTLISADEAIAQYWKDATKAEAELITALNRYFPPKSDAKMALKILDLEARYRTLALKACDIVDLANLPEDDRHIATRELELRRLYVALRLVIESSADESISDQTLSSLEVQRLTEWGTYNQKIERKKIRFSLGERLGKVRRLVVLGDPGAGKSTLLRWIATAYLLRLQGDPDWQTLPDVASLPTDNWLPILIRCRDLPAPPVTLDTMLHSSLRRAELSDKECETLVTFLRDKLTRGQALLLIDGLDEITDLRARTRVAEQIETIHHAMTVAPMVVTSRIVGYRETGHRIRAGFEHLTVSDLSRAEKDDFVRRWCALTERPDRRDTAADELIRDIHSSDRIERLTGNPMLLTTMALIKRKIGRLPQRRADLYEKSVEVLLNWRSAVDAAIDAREALPQLEYLAHAMCTDGVQQLREDQALELLHQCRNDYPNIHAIRRHSPEEFLQILERRTGLLIQSGRVRFGGRSVPTYEFRHLTLQEYLAALSLIQGHYKGFQPNIKLCEVVAPIAGQVEKSKSWGSKDIVVVARWRETLRLCLALSPDSQVDAALMAVLQPQSSEQGTTRARAVQAALCLADEPNASSEVARDIISVLIKNIEEFESYAPTSVSQAVRALSNSRWAAAIEESLINEFFVKNSPRGAIGVMFSDLQRGRIEPNEVADFFSNATTRLGACNEREAVSIILKVMMLAYEGHRCTVDGLTDRLICWLTAGAAVGHAAAWALGWLTHWRRSTSVKLDALQLEKIVNVASRTDFDSAALRFLCWVFAAHQTPKAVPLLIENLKHRPPEIKAEILEALGIIGEEIGTSGISQYLCHENELVRRKALSGLAHAHCDIIDRQLLAENVGANTNWLRALDPLALVTEDHVQRAVEQLKIQETEVRNRLNFLAIRFKLKLGWTSPKILPNNPSTSGMGNKPS